MDDANAAVELSLDRANRLIVGGAGDTLSLLQQAERELRDRLQWIAKKHGGPSGSYTEAHVQIYRQQIGLVTRYLQQRLQGKTDEQAREAIRLAVTQTVALATRLEERFTGITRPLALHSQTMQDEIVRGTGASRIRQNAASWERYGQVLTRDFERVLRLGQLEGATHAQMIDGLIAKGDRVGVTAQRLHEQTPGSFPEPTGYVAQRYWAERIVRTEVAHGYNAAALNTMQAAKNTDFPDLQKKILAHFDNRTAPDSVAVHGQVRPLDGYFMDGAGRTYLHPPGRPNDRETVIPWRPHWAELEATEPPTPTEQVEAQHEAAGVMPPPAHKAAQVAQKRLAAKAAVEEQKLAEKQAKEAQKAAIKAARAKARQEAREARQRKATADPLPEVLPVDAEGTPLRPVPYLPKKTVPKGEPEAVRIARGAALRAASSEGGHRTFRSKSTPELETQDENYQYKMWRGLHGKPAQVDNNAATGVNRFSHEHDFLIRRYQEGATRRELVALELVHQKRTEPDPYTLSLVEKKVDRAIRAAHEIERAFVLADDSPHKVVFRGIGGLSDEKLNLFLGSKHFDMKGMTSSTSTDPGVAENFMDGNIMKHKGHGLLMRLQRKSKGIGISAVSRYRDEEEVLVHGNTRYRVLSRNRIENTLGFEAWEIDAVEI